MINSNKANINEVKQAFKELFKNKKDELFEIILKNNTLKNNLLGEGLTKSEAKNVFGDLINSPWVSLEYDVLIPQFEYLNQ